MLATVALAGCGFAPIYGTGGAGRALQNRVLVESPETAETYVLVRYLEQRFGQPDPAAYGLSYSLTSSQQGLAVTAAQVIERYNVLGELTFALRDLSDNSIVTSGKVSGMTGYSATGTTIATRAARRDAEERLAFLLADRTIDQIILTFPEDGV